MEAKKTIAPRFRGLAIQEGSKWLWELLITIGPEEIVDPIVMRSSKKKPFISRDAALSDMRFELKRIMDVVCEAVNGTMPDGIIDLNAGVVTTHDEFFGTVHKD